LGKLSEPSIRYLLELGISPRKILEYCQREKIKIDESKLIKIAQQVMCNGKKRKKSVRGNKRT
jgi:hypothetical protein